MSQCQGATTLASDKKPRFATPQRRSFAMPQFVRLAWTSEHARQIWAPRFRQVIQAWGDVELLSVAHGIREVALVTVPTTKAAEYIGQCHSFGLTWIEVERGAQAYPDQHRISGPRSTEIIIRAAVGSKSSSLQCKEAWDAHDHDEVGRLLGYPQCCRAAFTRRCVVDKWEDPTWLIAAETTSGSVTTFEVAVTTDPATNLLTRCIGIRLVPHLPCNCDCSPTLRMAALFARTARQLGFDSQVQWLREILSWPASWTSLNGIAEIKLPVLKVVTSTDPTSEKLTVRWLGNRYPAEGAQGLAFPFRTSPLRATTDSRSYRRGLAWEADLVQLRPMGFDEHKG